MLIKGEVIEMTELNTVVIDKAYKHYLNNKENINIGRFANEILYKMCEEKPQHDSAEVISGKLLLIGRTYAAAYERRKIEGDIRDTETFYCEATRQIEESRDDNDWKRVDDWLKECIDLSDDEAMKKSISVHYKMTMLMKNRMAPDGKEGQIKTSLASKYLHFHCPEAFYIFDSRAKEAVNKCIISYSKRESVLESMENYNSEYGPFVVKADAIRKYLEKKPNCTMTTRDMDDLFLYAVDK